MFDNCCISLPYPCVSGRVNNKELELLYDLYAGRFSESTLLATYFYQSITLRDCNLNQLIREIKACELKHLNLLADAITVFGGDPVFAGTHNYFSGSYPSYEREIKSAIYSDLYLKEQIIEQYSKLERITQNSSLLELLSRILMDEKLHYDLLTNAYSNQLEFCE